MGIWSDDKGNVRAGRVIFSFFFIFIGLWLFLSSFTTVDSGERGVLLTFGKVEDTILQPGFNTITPFTQSVVHMDVRTQKEETQASAASKDLQTVSTKVALNFHIDPEHVNIIYKQLGKEYSSRVIDPAIQEAVKATTAKFTAEELITKRELVKEQIKIELRQRLVTYNIIVEEVSLTDFNFSPEFNAAIESKVTAEQNALRAKNDLERIKIEAEQKIAQAKGQAEATLTNAKAEAEAIKITGDALKQNPQLVQLEAVKKWNGQLPVYTGGFVPFLDVNAISQPKPV